MWKVIDYVTITKVLPFRRGWQGRTFKFNAGVHLGWAKQQPKTVTIVNKKTTVYHAKPVKLNVAKISRDGRVKISFNQPLYVPPFIETARQNSIYHEQYNMRRMLEGLPPVEDTDNEFKYTLDSIDVAKDILEVEVLFNDDDERKNLDYTVVLKDWTEDGIDIQLNFTDPTIVS